MLRGPMLSFRPRRSRSSTSSLDCSPQACPLRAPRTFALGGRFFPISFSLLFLSSSPSSASFLSRRGSTHRTSSGSLLCEEVALEGMACTPSSPSWDQRSLTSFWHSVSWSAVGSDSNLDLPSLAISSVPAWSLAPWCCKLGARCSWFLWWRDELFWGPWSAPLPRRCYLALRCSSLSTARGPWESCRGDLSAASGVLQIFLGFGPDRRFWWFQCASRRLSRSWLLEGTAPIEQVVWWGHAPLWSCMGPTWTESSWQSWSPRSDSAHRPCCIFSARFLRVARFLWCTSLCIAETGRRSSIPLRRHTDCHLLWIRLFSTYPS